MALGDKPSMYSGKDVNTLAKLSKKALLDIVVFRLRMEYHGSGEDEYALTEHQLREAINGDLSLRDDKFPKFG